MQNAIVPLVVALGLSSLSLYGQGPASASRPPAADGDLLSTLRMLKIPDGEVTYLQRETSPTLPNAKGAPMNLPPRVVVKLVLRPGKGSNINVEIWLPDAAKWNGRLLGLGNGGAAGHINSAGLAGPMASGYAVVTTDMGTSPNHDSGVGNPDVWKDFGYRATHLMTTAAKQIVQAYYTKGPEFSYFSGGSTGGQQAMQEAQRYPEDYDGIVASVPAHCRTPLHAYFLWNDQILKKTPFTKAQEANVIAAGNEYMAPREVPAVAGKFISDPRCRPEDIEAVIALARKKDRTLTDEHAEALRKLFDGPKREETGERIFNGIPLGCSLEAAHGHLYLFKWVFGAEKKLEEINFGEDIDTYTKALAPYLNAENADLSAFAKRGGKLMMTLGTADSVVPYHASLDYYERVIDAFHGDVRKVQEFCRFYLIPGMSHGPGPGLGQPGNLLETVRAWREKGTAPYELQGKRVVDGKVELEMPLYPYPKKTGWDAATGTYKAVDAAWGEVERVAERFRPAAAE